jgi:hypothetical protein
MLDEVIMTVIDDVVYDVTTASIAVHDNVNNVGWEAADDS